MRKLRPTGGALFHEGCNVFLKSHCNWLALHLLVPCRVVGAEKGIIDIRSVGAWRHTEFIRISLVAVGAVEVISIASSGNKVNEMPLRLHTGLLT